MEVDPVFESEIPCHAFESPEALILSGDVENRIRDPASEDLQGQEDLVEPLAPEVASGEKDGGFALEHLGLRNGNAPIESQGDGLKKGTIEPVGVSKRFGRCFGIGEAEVELGVGPPLQGAEVGIPEPAAQGISAGTVIGPGSPGSFGGVIVVDGPDPSAALSPQLVFQGGEGFAGIQEVEQLGVERSPGEKTSETSGEGEEGPGAGIEERFGPQGMEMEVWKVVRVAFVFPGRHMDLIGQLGEPATENACVGADTRADISELLREKKDSWGCHCVVVIDSPGAGA